MTHTITLANLQTMSTKANGEGKYSFAEIDSAPYMEAEQQYFNQNIAEIHRKLLLLKDKYNEEQYNKLAKTISKLIASITRQNYESLFQKLKLKEEQNEYPKIRTRGCETINKIDGVLICISLDLI